MPGVDGGGGGGGGGGRGGGRSGGSDSALGKNEHKSWGKSVAGLALCAPLLPRSDSEHESHWSSIPEDTTALDNSKHGSSRRSPDSFSFESKESWDTAPKGIAGSRGSTDLGTRRSIHSRVSAVSKRFFCSILYPESFAIISLCLCHLDIARSVEILSL